MKLIASLILFFFLFGCSDNEQLLETKSQNIKSEIVFFVHMPNSCVDQIIISTQGEIVYIQGQTRNHSDIIKEVETEINKKEYQIDTKDEEAFKVINDFIKKHERKTTVDGHKWDASRIVVYINGKIQIDVYGAQYFDEIIEFIELIEDRLKIRIRTYC